MKTIIFVTLILLCLSFGISAQEQAEDPMMKAYMEYATPGDAHKALSNLVGTWTAKVTTYMDPSGKPVEQTGTSTYKMIMDGRYLLEEVLSEFQGQKFQGMGLYGYDKGTQKYHSTWVDTMGTGIMSGTGSSSDGGKTIEWTSTAYDPLAKKEQTYIARCIRFRPTSIILRCQVQARMEKK